MSYSYYSMNNRNRHDNVRYKSDIQAAAPLAKPIETVQKSIEDSFDTIVKKADEEKNKKRNKTAIAVGSSVLVLSGIVALLNPRYSPKVVGKLKNLHNEAGKKVNKNNNTTSGKFYRGWQKFLGGTVKTTEFINNLNTSKDAGFKWLCTEKKECKGIKNNTVRKILTSIDSGFRKIMKKPHEIITNWFDNIGKDTVKKNYKKAGKKMNSLEELLSQYKTRLPKEQQIELESKLFEIRQTREYFSNNNLNNRFIEQENAMSNLLHDFAQKTREFKNGLSNNQTKKTEYLNKNMYFWAEDLVRPQRDKIEEQGLEVVSKLVGDGNGRRGAYNEAMEMITPYLNREEKIHLQKHARKTEDKLRKANFSECIEYFDKKRDLILGSAPTDVVTAALSLILSGALITAADNKDERISRTLTGVFPIVAGLGASMVFTAQLISGVRSMLYGALTSIGLSIAGSIADSKILGNKTKPQEAVNA